MKLSIIIPVYNEERTIIIILNKIIELKLPEVKKEIIVVDDGSTDTTALKIKGLNRKIKKFTFIQHSKNIGKGNAVKTGIKNATGDYIVVQDADLEYNPQDISILLGWVLKQKAEVVYGTRLKRMPHFSKEEKEIRFVVHYLGNKLLSFITSVLYGQWLTDIETCYKLFPREALSRIQLNAHGFEFEPEITAKLLKARYTIREVPIITNPRTYKDGKKLRTIHDGAIALWSLIKYRFTD